MSFLCVPIRARNMRQLRTLVRRAARDADILEIWMDSLPAALKKNPATVRALTGKKLLAVNKPVREKGEWKGTEKDRVDLLKKCADAGFDYIDIGVDTDVRLIAGLRENMRRPAKLIVSFHDFLKTPDVRELRRIVGKGAKLGADIVKIVTFAGKREDNITIAELLVEHRSKKSPALVAHAMGALGIPSRLLAPIFGSHIVYAALDGGKKSAPGQLTVKEYKRFASFFRSR